MFYKLTENINMKVILGALSVTILFHIGQTNKCQCGIANEKKGSGNRIVGGSVSEPHRYPWHVGVGGPVDFCAGGVSYQLIMSSQLLIVSRREGKPELML